MSRTERMDELLRIAFHPEHIAIRDDSARHSGHAGARSGGGHYHLEIVSALFEGKSPVMRHRMIHEVLGSMMRGEIHALSIRARTATEAASQPTLKEI